MTKVLEIVSSINIHIGMAIRIILMISTGLFSSNVWSTPYEILLLKSSSSEIYTEVVSTVKSAIRLSCQQSQHNICTDLRFLTMSLDSEKTMIHDSSLTADVIVTMGQSAAEYLAEQKIDKPVINSLIQKEYFDALGYVHKTRKTTSTYIDQPPERVFKLAKTILGNDLVVGVLLGPGTQNHQKQYMDIFDSAGVDHQIAVIHSEDSIGPVLSGLLNKITVLLTVPDPFLYNRKTIFNILLASYNSHVPVIGYSASYVKAGALSAVYSSPEDIGKNIAEMVFDFIKNNNLPTPSYPKHFSVSVNQTVAHSLGLTTPSEQSLKKLLMESM